MSLIIKKCSVHDIENSSSFVALLNAYEKEFTFEGAPSMRAKMELYRQFEKGGHLQVWGAFYSDGFDVVGEKILVGLITLLVTVLPHWGESFGVCESFFVLEDHRKGGTGMKLLDEAEQYTTDNGSDYILVSSPFGGALAEVLPHRGYKPTNIVFFKRLKNV